MATTEDPREVTAGGEAAETDTEAWRSALYDAVPERRGELFSTISGIDNEPLATPDS
ncbi:MAG: hypothetical protein H0X39_15480, partial [Actinobacteria bacterium]|nr:hypothetical protein [Actinomycetota bacterium]